MGFYFKKSLNFGLFRINISKSGIGISFGVKGCRISVDPKGKTTLNAGKGPLHYTKTLKKASNKKNNI